MNTFRLEYDRDHVQKALLSDLEILAKHEPRPDLVLFTGDLAFGHTSEEAIDSQFDLGFSLLDKIRQVWAPVVEKKDVYLVPGNHDVRRDFATPAISNWLDGVTDPRTLATLMKRHDHQWDQVIERLKPYQQALQRHDYGHLLQDPSSLTYQHDRTINGHEIRVCGLNSAWSCVTDQEKGRLWMCGKWQVAMVSKGSMPKTSICLIHHPLGWLREEENAAALDRLTQSTFTFSLHGHEHDEWVTELPNHIRVAAAACYAEEDAENGYNLTSYNPATGEVSVRLRRYEKRGRGWVPNIISGKTDDRGVWRIRTLSANDLAVGNSRRMSVTLTAPNAKNFDAFVAVPMAALSSEQYGQQRKELKKIIRTLRREWGSKRVYYPAEHLKGDKWDPADLAMVRGLKAIANSRLFIMIYNTDKPSSILVEAGYALAHHVPSIYFVKSGLKLPFLLEAAGQAFSDVKAYSFEHYDDIVSILKEYRVEFADLLSAGNDLLTAGDSAEHLDS